MIKKNNSIFFYIFICFLFTSCSEITDVFPPKLTILEPTSSEPVQSNFNVILDVEDNYKVESVEITIWNKNTKIYNQTLDSEPWETSIALDFTGYVTLEAIAFDEVGNFVNKEQSFEIMNQSSPLIILTSPNGGEEWEPGTSQTITWDSFNLSGNIVGISLYKSGNYVNSIISGTSNDGTYNWYISSGQEHSDYYKIKIYSSSNSEISDFSDDYFKIGESSGGSTQSITVTSPNGGEEWEPGAYHTITWNSSNLSGSYVGISLYRFGNYSSSISNSTGNDGTYSWSIPSNQTESDYYQIRIYSSSDNSVNDLSDNYFTIEESESSGNPSITLISPNGGESIARGNTYNITWSSDNLSGDHVVLRLYLSGNYVANISGYTLDDGSYTWQIHSNATESNMYQIKIYDYNDESVYDFSDSYFTIEEATPSITVTSPNGGEDWESGMSYSITWNSISLPGEYVGIHLYKNGSYVSSISSSTSDDGTYSWSVPSSLTDSDYYKILIYSTSESSISDASDNYFTINNSSSCSTPSNLQTTDITTTSAILDWSSVTDAVSYNVRYRQSGQSWQVSSDITTSSAYWSGLTANTSYQWQVQSDCGSTTSSWSSIITFTTSGGSGNGEDCDNPYYCSDCDGCEGSCCPNYCSGFYYYYNRTCDGNGFCIGATSDYCPDGCNDNGCL